MTSYLNEIEGQERAKKILLPQIRSGEFSHAYLIVGNEGSGKKFISKCLAKSIIIGKNSVNAERQLKMIENNIHPDLIVLDGTEKIKIEEIRYLIERINLSPNISEKKVAIILDAQNMGLEAANALLKTLEEPPQDSVLILTGITEKSFPETIISRTQKIKLENLTEKSLLKILESQGFDRVAIETALPYSFGMIGEAIKILSDKSYEKEVRTIFREVERLFLTRDPIEAFKILDARDKKKNLSVFFNTLTTILFQSFDPEKISDYLDNIRTKLSEGKRRLICNKILKIQRNLDYNINLRMAMEGLILECLDYD